MAHSMRALWNNMLPPKADEPSTSRAVTKVPESGNNEPSMYPEKELEATHVPKRKKDSWQNRKVIQKSEPSSSRGATNARRGYRGRGPSSGQSRYSQMNMPRPQYNNNQRAAENSNIQQSETYEYTIKKMKSDNEPEPRLNRILGFKKLEELAGKENSEILFNLVMPFSGLTDFLQTISAERRDVVALFIIVMSKACDSLHRQNVLSFVNTITKSKNFMYCVLMQYLGSFQNEPSRQNHLNSLFCLIDFLDFYQKTLPASASQILNAILPLLKVTCTTVFKDTDLKEIMDRMKEIEDQTSSFIKDHTKQEIKRTSYEEQVHNQQPPENYREIPILPTPKDIQQHVPFLRPNIVNGKYSDINHYLDVQFRLLREDYIKPLREGITTIKRLTTLNQPLTRNKDVKIYKNVHIVNQEFFKGNLVFFAKFDSTQFTNVNWEYSKRFLTGSLLCLSSDNFETIFFASVANRDCEKLKQGILVLNAEENSSMEVLNTNPFESYIMLETDAYFEAYRHNLAALKEVESDNFSFAKYIVSIETKVDPPSYLKKSTLFDMAPITKYYDSRKEFPVTVLSTDTWPTPRELELDQSQFMALRTAVTNEFSIIQGPPGTGKTYVGLKIVQLLLRNTSKSCPILIACYTNHALDQFLEGIQSFTNQIVRIGGRCSVEAISEYKLINQKKIVRSRREVPHHIFSSVSQQHLILDDLSKAVSKLHTELLNSCHFLIHENSLKSVMTEEHYNSLKSHASIPSYASDEHEISRWLGVHSNNFYDEPENKQTMVVVESGNKNPLVNNVIVHQQMRPVIIGNEQPQETYEMDEAGEFDIEFIEGMRNVEDDDQLDGNYRKAIINNITPSNPNKKSKIAKQLDETIAMTNAEVLQVTNVWKLNANNKWRLYKFWLQKFQQEKQVEYIQTQDQIKEEFKKLKEMRTEEDLFVMKQARIIGLTTTGVAKYRDLVNIIKPEIIVIEEAAEILESHIVTMLTEHAKHVILIGDHQQLKPNPNVYELAVKYNLNVSLFERLVKNGMPYCQLTKQHRMRPEIAELLVPHIYPNLVNHESVLDFEDIKGVTKNIFFVSHNYLEGNEDDSKSRVNRHEANFIIELCKYLLLQGYDSSQITILTAYSGQLFKLRKQRGTLDLLKGIRITVVDNFQGEENDIILMSFVRSNEEGNIGFLKVSNRVCVALSRARKGLYCIGNFDLLSENSQLWKNITGTLEKQAAIGPALTLQCQNHPEVLTTVAKEKDFETVAEGGCSRPCEFRLTCGHTCTRICHSYDREHENFKCTKPCEKVICTLGHKCCKKCHQECGPCNVTVSRILPKCLHTVSMKCHISVNDFVCTTPCPKSLPCNHKCKKICGEVCNSADCREDIDVILTCGHTTQVSCNKSKQAPEKLLKYCENKCKTQLQCGHMCSGTCGECYQKRLHKQCTKRCTRILVCGHECKSNCSLNCPPCKRSCENRCFHSKCPKKCGEPCSLCKEKCVWRCKHLMCKKLCGDFCDRLPCDEPCRKKVKCGHECCGLCGEPCPEKCPKCHPEVTEIFFGTEEEEDARFVMLEDCGHIFEVQGLSQWMADEDKEVQMKSCPKCKIIIRRNHRFGNTIKTGLLNIEKVKIAVYGRADENKTKIRALLKKFNNPIRHNLNQLHLSNNKYFPILMKPILNYLEERQKKLSKMDISRCENILTITEEFISIDHSTIDSIRMYDSSSSGSQLYNFSQKTKTMISEFIKNTFITASEQQLQEINWELLRYKYLIKTSKFLLDRHVLSKPQAKVHFDDLVNVICKLGPFCEEDEVKFNNIFQKMVNASGSAILNVSENEKKLILGAMNLPQGHWYQCPNGHVYCITDCGGAMEESNCNECGASIGGTSHQLRNDNAVARDMDGASHSAWSDTVNMLNYQFRN